jgi:hypothetical protein
MLIAQTRQVFEAAASRMSQMVYPPFDDLAGAEFRWAFADILES